MNEIAINVSRVNWKLLRKQKDKLVVESIISSDDNPKLSEALDGIISWIDDIQYQAALQLGERKVLGK